MKHLLKANRPQNSSDIVRIGSDGVYGCYFSVLGIASNKANNALNTFRTPGIFVQGIIL